MSGDLSLSHITRRRLCEYIAENPGISFNILRSAFKINEGTLRYHLEYLVKRERLRAEKVRNRRCYYLFTYRPGGPNVGVIELSRAQLRLLDIIKEDPGIGRATLLEMSRQDRKELTYDLSRLKKLKLIWKVSGPNGSGYEYVTDDMLYDSLITTLVERLMEGRIDQDEFILLKERLVRMMDGYDRR